MTKQKELDKKLEEIKKLSNIIVLHKGQALTALQKQEIDNWQGKLEFRLTELLEEMKIKEAETKLECMREVVRIIQNV